MTPAKLELDRILDAHLETAPARLASHRSPAGGVLGPPAASGTGSSPRTAATTLDLQRRRALSPAPS